MIFIIILSVDQGLANFGYAVLSKTDEKIELITYGCFVTKSTGDQAERIYNLMSQLEGLIETYNPEQIVHERLFFSPPAKNMRKKSASILNTNMITGAMWYIAGKHGIPVSQFSPQTVKKILTGNGRADKTVMIKKIENMFTIECLKSRKEHICDAVAIGLAYIKNDSNTEEE